MPGKQIERSRHLTLQGSWWSFAVGACGACVGLTVVIWLSAHLHADPVLRNVALFVHLASLVLGFGAVLIVDYFFLLWLFGRATFTETMNSAMRLHVPIWIGLSGLVLSGTLLEPNLSSGLTQLKLAFVVMLTLNGAQLPILSKRIKASAGMLNAKLLSWSVATTTVSQVCWWGAMWIGFWSTNHRL